MLAERVCEAYTAAGYRTIIPSLRGYRTAHFRSAATPRNGQQAAIAADVVALMDAPDVGFHPIVH